MRPIEGRLQTGEHILAKIIEDKIQDVRVGVCKFYEDHGILELTSQIDIRQLNQNELENETNEIIDKGFRVTKTIYPRQEAEKQFALDKVPSTVEEIRIVDIEGFDKRPCKDSHVDNTKQVGIFNILKMKRVGKDRYRITFSVK